MNALSTLVLLSGYLAFWAALLFGQRVFLDAQSSHLAAALNVSAARWHCAQAQSLAGSGYVVLLDSSRPDCGLPSWRPEVLPRVS